MNSNEQITEISFEVLKIYNERKTIGKIKGTKENIFTSVVHNKYNELKQAGMIVISENEFFRQISKECKKIQPNKSEKKKEEREEKTFLRDAKKRVRDEIRILFGGSEEEYYASVYD